MKTIISKHQKKSVLMLALIFAVAEAAVFFAVESWIYRLIGTAGALILCFLVGIVLHYGVRTIIQAIKEHPKTAVIFLICMLFAVKLVINCTSHHNPTTVFGKYALCIQLIMMPTIILALLGIYVWKLKIWKLYLILGIGVGLAMMLLIPLGDVPDEVVHINTTYSVSNTILGIQNSAEGLVMRADDAAFAINDYSRNQWSTVGEFEVYISQLLNPLQDATLVTANVKTIGYSYCYIIPALGVSLGRILGLGSGMTLMLGRLFNFAAFMALTTWAIKVIPFGKLPMLVVMLMPMTIQQGMSFSYDVCVNELSFVVIAYTIKIAFSTVKPGLTKKEMILLAFVCLFLFPLKGKAYFLLCLMPWGLMLYRKYPPSPKAWQIFKHTVIWVIVIAAVSFVVWGLTGASSYQYTPNMIDYNGTLDVPVECYSISYFIAHPFEFLPVISLTFQTLWQFYTDSFIGEWLGWLDLALPHYVTVIFWCLLFFSSIKRKGSQLEISSKMKKTFLIIFILTAGFIFAGLMISWSDISKGIIEGVQGRYMIPIALLGLFTLNSDKLQIDSKCDNTIKMVLVMTLLVSVEYLMTRF